MEAPLGTHAIECQKGPVMPHSLCSISYRLNFICNTEQQHLSQTTEPTRLQPVLPMLSHAGDFADFLGYLKASPYEFPGGNPYSL